MDDEPLLLLAAKRVAEERQHGCHYAEGACPECVAIAESVLRAIFPKVPPAGCIDWMARAHSPRLWNEIDEREDGHPSWCCAAKEGARNDMGAAYRAMPVWRVLWRYDD